MSNVVPFMDADLAMVGERIPPFQIFLQKSNIEGLLFVA